MRSHTHLAPPGFSLLEICVVLAILAAASAVPSRLLPALSGREATATAATIAADLRAVRDAALAAAAELDVLIGADGSTYRLPAGDRALPADNRLAGPRRLRFFADGSASPAKLSVTVGGRRAWIHVSPLTGGIETGADAD